MDLLRPKKKVKTSYIKKSELFLIILPLKMRNSLGHILFHRHTPWQGEIRCSTNIFASLFMQDECEVTYMQGMVNMGHVIAQKGRYEYWQKGPRREHGAWVFTPMSLVPFARFAPFNSLLAVKLAYQTCVPSVRLQVLKSGFEEPGIIWTANPGSTVLRKSFPNAKIIFQVVDYYPAFSGNSIKQIERFDYHEADHIFVIGETLKNYIVQDYAVDPEKITVLGQGVFTENYNDQLKLPDEYRHLSGPIGVWVGVISKCDAVMFEAAAQKLKQLGGCLVMIGPTAPWVEELNRKYENVHLLGSRTPEQVPAYLWHADIGLMLYDQEKQEVYKGQNPLKLYEYAAAGLPIISTDHDEFRYLDSPAIVVTDQSHITDAIEHAIDKHDSLRQQSLEFVADRSWHSVYQHARETIESVVVQSN